VHAGLPCKEQPGGTLLPEGDDLDRALQLMSKHAGVRGGPFEIRPAADLTGMICDSERWRWIGHLHVAGRVHLARAACGRCEPAKQEG
jgi:hypothetical protein